MLPLSYNIFIVIITRYYNIKNNSNLGYVKHQKYVRYFTIFWQYFGPLNIKFNLEINR